jgi:uncharacterized RDD family membrane protein YckC
MAFFIDIFVMGLGAMLANQMITWTTNFFRLGTLEVGRGVIHFVARASVVSTVALYLPVSWALTGQSVGKFILGLQIVRANPKHPTETGLSFARSVVRGCGYWLSALPLGLGFLWILADPHRRAWHDILAGTRVVYRPRVAIGVGHATGPHGSRPS